MNQKDRSEWFNRLKNDEQNSSKRVDEILRQQKERVRRRSGRKKVWMASAVSLLLLGASLWCVSWLGSLVSNGQARQWEQDRETRADIQETDVHAYGQKINETEETSEETEIQETVTQEAAAPAPAPDVQLPLSSSVFYGNTIMSTAGGISVDVSKLLTPSWIQEQYLTVNSFSRPCIAMNSIQHIAIHYVGNAGTTASQNRSYFEGLKDTQITQASSHFIVGLEGEVIQCIPLNEMSYCTNERNVDTISIEVCHPDEGGQFTEATYQSVVRLTAWLCQKFALQTDSVIRHYDVTGKICPKYYVEHPEAWDTLKADIQTYLNQNPDIN